MHLILEGARLVQVKIPGLASPLEGVEPVVILGANGSGKTRLALQMANDPSCEFIPALRQIVLPDQLPNWSAREAENQLRSRTHQRLSRQWDMIGDIDALFGKLVSEHATESMRFRDRALADGVIPDTPATILDKTRELWMTVFPGRSIEFDFVSATVLNEKQGATRYTAKEMSDGERTGLYLAAKVLESAREVIVVDEPETHFHSRLAVRFWDALEALCSNKRFVYATHDLAFALSRREARVVLVRTGEPPELISAGNALPKEDIASILGAASFSVYAQRIVFCEGREEKSLDQELLRAWFNDRDTALIPAGGCENVKRCALAFQSDRVVSGLQAIGIVDRDHWPDELLQGAIGLHVLAVHEVESLYVLPDVFRAIAGHVSPELDAAAKYKELLESWRRQIKGTAANKLIYERYRARAMLLFERAFGAISDFSDRNRARAEALESMGLSETLRTPETLWDEESSSVDSALASDDPIEFLRVFPGKPLVSHAAAKLGVSKERYCELVRDGLRSKGDTFKKMRAELEMALSAFLPYRTLSRQIQTEPRHDRG